MGESKFSLSENEKDKILNTLSAHEFDKQLDPYINISNDEFRKMIADIDDFLGEDERVEEICNNIIEPIYKKTDTPSYDDLRSQMANHGIELPERISHDETMENAGLDKSSVNDNSKDGAASSTESKSESEKDKENKYVLDPEEVQAGLRRNQELEKSAKAQTQDIHRAAHSNPHALMGQLGAKFFNVVRKLWDNFWAGTFINSRKIAPVERENKNVISAFDGINEYRKGCNNFSKLSSQGCEETLDTMIKKGFENFSMLKQHSDVDENDVRVFENSVATLDEKIKKEGFDKDPKINKGMEELKKLVKDLFAGFGKKGPSKDEPSPN